MVMRKLLLVIVTALALGVVYMVYVNLDKSDEVVEIQQKLVSSGALKKELGDFERLTFIRRGSKIRKFGSGKASGRFFFLAKAKKDNYRIKVTWSRENPSMPLEGRIAVNEMQEIKLGE